MPIKHVLVDNGSLGKIGKEQRAGQFPEWQVSLVNPDFAAYARLCGAGGETVRTRGEIEPAMARMLAAEGPYLLHVVQDAELV
jgi:thiamine pyrophosphate-dependent acetolactate synthase large subunit-like protein